MNIHTHINIHTETQIHTHTHTHKLTHIHKHIHTHTHTHTLNLERGPPLGVMLLCRRQIEQMAFTNYPSVQLLVLTLSVGSTEV